MNTNMVRADFALQMLAQAQPVSEKHADNPKSVILITAIVELQRLYKMEAIAREVVVADNEHLASELEWLRKALNDG